MTEIKLVRFEAQVIEDMSILHSTNILTEKHHIDPCLKETRLKIFTSIVYNMKTCYIITHSD